MVISITLDYCYLFLNVYLKGILLQISHKQTPPPFFKCWELNAGLTCTEQAVYQWTVPSAPLHKILKYEYNFFSIFETVSYVAHASLELSVYSPGWPRIHGITSPESVLAGVRLLSRCPTTYSAVICLCCSCSFWCAHQMVSVHPFVGILLFCVWLILQLISLCLEFIFVSGDWAYMHGW